MRRVFTALLLTTACASVLSATKSKAQINDISHRGLRMAGDCYMANDAHHSHAFALDCREEMEFLGSEVHSSLQYVDNKADDNTTNISENLTKIQDNTINITTVDNKAGTNLNNISANLTKFNTNISNYILKTSSFSGNYLSN